MSNFSRSRVGYVNPKEAQGKSITQALDPPTVVHAQRPKVTAAEPDDEKDIAGGQTAGNFGAIVGEKGKI
jgi:hypothetical protein